MNSTINDAILSAVAAFIGQRKPGDVLNSLYHRTLPAADDGLNTVADLLPTDQISVVRLIDGLNLQGLRCVVILLATLRRLRTEEAWIHYNLCKHLRLLVESGVGEAKLPAIIHSLLTIEGLKDTASGALSLPLGVLAQHLGGFAPREAIRSGLLAARYGNPAALEFAAPSVDALGLQVGLELPSMTRSLVLAKSLQFAATDISQSASLGKIEGLRSTIIESAKVITFPSVSGDGSHYIFGGSGKKFSLPAISVHTLERGTYSVDATMRGLEQHYVFDKNGDCVVELANGVNPFIADTVMEFDEPVAILDDKFSGAMSICHFLLDGLTRIPIYERNDPKPGKFLIADGFPYYRQIFERMGTADRIVIPAQKRVSVRAPQLLFSSNIAADFRHPAHLCAPWAIDYLRSALHIDDRPSDKEKKIFISRTDAVGRAILNWQEVVPMLQRFGFKVVELTGMSAQAQIELFRNASQVVGVHGAGLTNILFAPRDCAVLEILSPLVATHAYWLLASSLGQRYSALIADDPELPRPDYKNWRHNPASYNQNDVIVPIAKLEMALSSL
jgi:hypothetical protein